jgi:predicted nucleic acid-binding protein
VIYLDTSYIAKCYVREPGTERILAWLRGKRGLTCCSHGRLELYAAIKRHVLEGRLSEKQAAGSFRLLEQDEKAGIWNWIPVSEGLIREACRRVASLKATVRVRAADALHLTCATENGFTAIYSHDTQILAAARYFGLAPQDILE